MGSLVLVVTVLGRGLDMVSVLVRNAVVAVAIGLPTNHKDKS